MCSSKLLVREEDRERASGGIKREGESDTAREKTPFGAEMERIDSVAPSGKRHF